MVQKFMSDFWVTPPHSYYQCSYTLTNRTLFGLKYCCMSTGQNETDITNLQHCHP